MKVLTVTEFEAGIRGKKINIQRLLPGATGIVFLGAMEGEDEILFRVAGL